MIRLAKLAKTLIAILLIATAVGLFAATDVSAQASSSTGEDFSWSGTGTQQDGGSAGATTVALSLFEQAMGIRTSTNSCMSCTFMSFFMLSLTDFSFLTYQYFYNFFIALAPLLMTAWLGYRAAKLMIMGGEGGKDFLYGVVGKLALFTIIYLFATGAAQNNRHLWQMTGPSFLTYTFDFSNEVRTAAIVNTNAVRSESGNGRFLCQGISVPALGNTNTLEAVYNAQTIYSFLPSAVESACFTERVHIMGIASGAALAFDANSGNPTGWSNLDPSAWLAFFWAAAVKLLIGFFIILTYAISAIWLIFLILDVVVRGMITAALSPFLAIFALSKNTRYITTGAIKGLGGAVFTAVALSIVSSLAYVLVTNTVAVYEITKDDVIARYETWDQDEAPDLQNYDNDRIESMRQFIQYVGEGNTTRTHIPMDFGTPWFWYMAFSGVAIFALGKKLIAMLEGLVGYQGASAFADNALKSVRLGATGAVVATGAIAASTMAAGRLAAPMAGAGAGAIGGAAGTGMNAIGSGLQNASQALSPKNILSATQLAASAAQRSTPGSSD